jgi:hypothetical protein
MKNLIVSSCICLALVVAPCAYCAEHPKAEKAGSILSTGLLGAGAGIIVGVAAVALSGSGSGSAIAAGALLGFVLGAVLVIATPETEDTAQDNAPKEGSPPPAAVPGEAH